MVGFWFPLVLQGLNLVAGVLYLRWAGLRRHLGLLLVLLLVGVYLFYTPLALYLSGTDELFGIGYGAYFGPMMSTYAGGFAAFLLGYTLLAERKTRYPAFFFSGRLPPPRFLDGLFWALMALILLNYLLPDYSLIDYLMVGHRAGQRVLNPQGFSNYLEALLDSLIAVLFLGLLVRFPAWRWLLYALLACAFFMLVGFRYRVLLLALGGLYQFLRWWTGRRWALLPLLAVFVFSGYLALFLTENRYYITHARFKEINFQLKRFNHHQFLVQTGNPQALMVVMKRVKEDGFAHGYGHTMLLGPLLRGVPGFFFPGEKPLPAQAKALPQMYGEEDFFHKRRALGLMGEGWFAGGWAGAVLWALLWGMAAGWVAQCRGPEGHFWQLVFLALFFQEFTRGYFPQTVELAAFLLLPVLLWRLLGAQRFFRKKRY